MTSSLSPEPLAAVPNGFQLRWVTDEAAWLALAPEWDHLLARMARPSPFLLFDWLDTWRRHFARRSRLAVVTVRRPGGELAAAAPLHIVPRRAAGVWPLRSLEFLGYRGSRVCGDHYDFLAAESERQALADVLTAELLRSQDWDAAVLADLMQDSPWPAAWRRLAPRLSVVERPAEVCYYVPLDAEVDAFWAGIKRQHAVFARSVHRYRKRLHQLRRVRLVAPVPPSEVAATLAALTRLNVLARDRRGAVGNFSHAAYSSFHLDLLRRMAGAPELYLARLDVDEAPAAVFYGFHCGGVLYFYQQGFDPGLAAFGVGKLMLAEVIEDAIVRSGIRELDFLRGNEAYKTHWTSLARHTRSLWVWRGGAAARLHQAAWRTRRALGRWRRLRTPRPGPGA